MPDKQSVVIVGGTAGIGRQLAQTLAKRGDEVVITGRDKARAQAVPVRFQAPMKGLRPGDYIAQLNLIEKCEKLRPGFRRRNSLLHSRCLVHKVI